MAKNIFEENGIKRQESLNNALNKSIGVRIKNDTKTKLNDNVTTTKTTTYAINSDKIKQDINKEFGVDIDKALNDIKDKEVMGYAKISAVSNLRKYTRDNLKRLIQAN